MSTYAKGTTVDSAKSRMEIEATLRRYGASAFAYGWTSKMAVVEFSISGLHIRFNLPLPDPGAREFTHTAARNQRRTESGRAEAYEQAVRQRWRALALVIKAKLEAVQSGITSVEDEFLAHIVIEGGATIGEHLAPQMAAIKDGHWQPAITAGPR